MLRDAEVSPNDDPPSRSLWDTWLIDLRVNQHIGAKPTNPDGSVRAQFLTRGELRTGRADLRDGSANPHIHPASPRRRIRIRAQSPAIGREECRLVLDQHHACTAHRQVGIVFRHHVVEHIHQRARRLDTCWTTAHGHEGQRAIIKQRRFAVSSFEAIEDSIAQPHRIWKGVERERMARGAGNAKETGHGVGSKHEIVKRQILAIHACCGIACGIACGEPHPASLPIHASDGHLPKGQIILVAEH